MTLEKWKEPAGNDSIKIKILIKPFLNHVRITPDKSDQAETHEYE